MSKHSSILGVWLEGVGWGQAGRFQGAFKYQMGLIEEKKIRHRVKRIITKEKEINKYGCCGLKCVPQKVMFKS